MRRFASRRGAAALILALIGLWALAGASSASAQTVTVSPGPASVNHANPWDTSTIAHALHVRAPGGTVRMQAGDYYIDGTLTIPPGTTLRAAPGAGLPRIRSRCVSCRMVRMTNYSRLFTIELNGQNRARTIVFVNEAHDVQIRDAVLHRTKHDYQSPNERAHVIHILESANVAIRDTLVRRAGRDVNNNGPHPWSGPGLDTEGGVLASGMYIHKSYRITIENVDLAYTWTHGIDFTRSAQVAVRNSRIQHTNMGGITAYHNYGANNYFAGYRGPNGNSCAAHQCLRISRNAHSWEPETNLIYRVTHNHITSYGNHGVTLSGRDIAIHNNQVGGGRYNAVHIGDWRGVDPPKDHRDCSSLVDVSWNQLTTGWAANPPESRRTETEGLRIDGFRTGTIGYSGNSISVLSPNASAVAIGTRRC